MSVIEAKWNLRISFDLYLVDREVAQESCRLAGLRALEKFTGLAVIEKESTRLSLFDVEPEHLPKLVEFVGACVEDYLLHNVELYRRAPDVWEAQQSLAQMRQALQRREGIA